MIAKLHSYIKLLIFLSILYIYIYNPIFQSVGFGLIKVLLLVSIFYILIKRKRARLLFSTFYNEIFFAFLLIAYSLFVYAFIGNAGRTMIAYHIFWFLECFVVSIFLVFLFKRYFIKYDFKDLMIVIGFIASIITLYLVLNPSVNLHVRENVIIDTLDLFKEERQAEGFFDYRGFSLAENSSFYYGIVQGIVLGFCVIKSKESFWYLIPIITLFISIIFNARIGLVVFIIAFFLTILYRRFSLQKLTAFALLFAFVIFVVMRTGFVEEYSSSLEWGLSFFTESRSLFGSSFEETDFSMVFRDMWFLPESFLGLLFGTGENIFLSTKKNSDVGYIIQIFEGGLFYLGLMISYLLFMYKRVKKISKDNLLPLFFLLVILIADIKGNALFISSGFFRMFVLYYTVTILLKKTYQPMMSANQVIKIKNENNY